MPTKAAKDLPEVHLIVKALSGTMTALVQGIALLLQDPTPKTGRFLIKVSPRSFRAMSTRVGILIRQQFKHTRDGFGLPFCRAFE